MAWSPYRSWHFLRRVSAADEAAHFLWADQPEAGGVVATRSGGIADLAIGRASGNVDAARGHADAKVSRAWPAGRLWCLRLPALLRRCAR
jgi:hypothetical protein